MMFRTLISQWSSIVISLFLAVFVWVVATNEENPTREAIFQDPISIQLVNRGEGLTVLEKAPDTLHVRIRAPEANWQNLRAESFRAEADLKGLGPGLQSVPVNVTSADPQVKIIESDTTAVRVRLDAMKQITMEVRVNVLDAAPVGYEFKNASANPPQITISGPQSIIEQINDATADIALRGAKSSIDRTVPIVLHDAQGNVIQNVTVSPTTVAAHVEVDQRVGYKEVAVKAVLKGSVSAGYWVSNITVDPPTVTLVGTPEALDRIAGYVEAQSVLVTGARDDVNKQVGLSLPQGVTALTAGNVDVRISVQPVTGGITIFRPVTVSELRCDSPVTVSPDTVELILSGPLPILQALTPDDVQIIVDVDGCLPSSFQATPRVVNYPDSIKVESIVPNTVEVNIKQR